MVSNGGYISLKNIKKFKSYFTALFRFSTYVSIKYKRHALKVPKSVPMDAAATLPCSALTSYNAVMAVQSIIKKTMACIRRGTLLVIGTGGLAMWCVQIARFVLPKDTWIVCAGRTVTKKCF